MRLLIETHLLLWWMDNTPSLCDTARKLISDPANLIFVSVISLLEIRLKESLGKLRLPTDFEAKLSQEAFESLPLTANFATSLCCLGTIGIPSTAC